MRLLDTHPDESPATTDGESGGGGGGGTTEESESSGMGVRARVLSGHTSTISDVSVIRDNNGGKIAFASSSLDGTVRLWDTQTGEALSTLRHNPRIVNSGSSSRSGNSSGGGSSSPGSTGVGDSESVSVLSVAATEERSPSMYTGAADGSLWSWDVTMGKLTRRIRSAHSAPVTSVKVAAMETARVVTGSSDNTVKVWDMRQKRPLVYTLRGHTAPVTTLEVEPAWGRIFSGSKDQSLRVWDIRTGRPTHALQDHFGTVQCVMASPRVLHGFVSGARDSSIKFWNREGQCMRTLRAHRGVVYSMALQPMPTMLSGFGPGVGVLTGQSGGGGGGGGDGSIGMSSAGGSSGGPTGASFDQDTGISGVQMGGGSTREAWDPPVLSIQEAGDAGGGGGSGGGTARGAEYATMSNTLRSSVTGPLLASGGADGKVRLWDCTRKKCVSELEGHRGAVYATKWASPECVVSASADCTVRAWDVRTERCLTLEGHKGAVTHIHCDQDCILSASKDSTLRLWSLGTAFGL
jgi:WD40 repeat protein